MYVCTDVYLCLFVLIVQKYLSEHVAISCFELVLPPSEVLREVKTLRKNAFQNNLPGYEMGMKECPNCKQLGLFVHDGNLAQCVHPDHDKICAEINKKADDEAREAARNAAKPRERKCLTCACSGWFKPQASSNQLKERILRHDVTITFVCPHLNWRFHVNEGSVMDVCRFSASDVTGASKCISVCS